MIIIYRQLVFSFFFVFILYFLLFQYAFNSYGDWRGGVHHDMAQKGSALKLTTAAISSATFDPTRVTQLSPQPRLFIYKEFLTDEKCDCLISLGKDKLQKSTVIDDKTGMKYESDVRTSSGMFLDNAQDEVVAGIEAKIAARTFLPPQNGECLQILRYEHGQKYEPHYDSLFDKFNQQKGGNRVATVLIYLSNVDKGGETVFPGIEAKDFQPKDDSWSDCAKAGYAVKPKKGDTLFFFSLHLNATADLSSYHGSCPVIEGEKWSATKWIRVRSYDKSADHTASSECIDENERCTQWAAAGECEKNPLYMVGSEDYIGVCRKSCKACSS